MGKYPAFPRWHIKTKTEAKGEFGCHSKKLSFLIFLLGHGNHYLQCSFPFILFQKKYCCFQCKCDRHLFLSTSTRKDYLTVGVNAEYFEKSVDGVIFVLHLSAIKKKSATQGTAKDLTQKCHVLLRMAKKNYVNLHVNERRGWWNFSV